MLGYALYATVFGALGSLGSRAEDAQSVAGPALVVLLAAFFASFFMITQPASAAAKAISYFPLTAPFAMPGRIAMGATAWWEPVLAVALALATITGPGRENRRAHRPPARPPMRAQDHQHRRLRPVPAGTQLAC